MANTELNPPTSEQSQAWAYYGTPNTPAKRTGGKSAVTPKVGSSIGKQVGEVRYIIGWMADQMVRMGWRVTINGSETWSIQVTDGSTVSSDATNADTESPTHPANASRRLLETIDWNTRTVREITTNLFVAGEVHYCNDGDAWRVVSVVRPDREAIVSRSSLVVHGLWPHPADPQAPDAPIFGVLPILDDMAWLNRLSRSQSANRVGMRGIIGVADTFKTANGAAGDEFWADFEDSLSRPMEDPEDVSPVGIIGPKELVEPKAGGKGMAGLSWVIPEFPYDTKIDERMEKLVQRLAYGLPIPPEILLGLQAQSKATAFQVEGSTYRAHIEPVAFLISQVATDTLRAFLPEGMRETAEVIPDPTTILARRHSVSDVLEAFDRGAVGFEYLREILGIPERAASTEEDIELRQRVAGRAEIVDGISDPADEAASEPISAAATLPAGETPGIESPQTPDDNYMSDLLHRIDTATLYELIGASQQAVTTARERLGARIRSTASLKDRIETKLSNEEVTLKYGKAALGALGQKGDQIISDSLKSTLTWWEKRLTRSQQEVRNALELGGVTEISFDQLRSNQSVTVLGALLAAAVTEGTPLKETDLRDVVTMAGS